MFKKTHSVAGRNKSELQTGNKTGKMSFKLYPHNLLTLPSPSALLLSALGTLTDGLRHAHLHTNNL